MSMQNEPDVADDANERAKRLRDEAAAVGGRIALPRPDRDPAASPRSGGDASKAPTSLSAVELHPIEGDSSGRTWDDPEEL